MAIIGADATTQLFGTRDSIGQTVHLNGTPYTVIGKIRKKDQDSNYSGPDNDKVFIPFSAMARDFPRTDAAAGVVSQIILAPQPWVRRPAAARARRAAPAASRTSTGRSSAKSAASCSRRHGFDAGRPQRRRDVGHVAPDADVRPHGPGDEGLLQHRRHRHAGARRARRDEHHARRRARADARDRRAQGARRDDRADPAAVLPRRVRADDAQRRDRLRRGAGAVRGGQPAADADAVPGDDPDLAGRRWRGGSR